MPFIHNVLIFSDSKSTIEAITPNTQHWSPMMWRVANYPPTLIKQIRTIIDQRLRSGGSHTVIQHIHSHLE